MARKPDGVEGSAAPAPNLSTRPPPGSSREVCQRFHQAVELIGRRWTGAILHVLLQGPARFSEIAAALPAMTDRMLSGRLRELESEGLVDRTVYPEVPVRVEYALTEKGRDLTPALDELADWAHRWLPE